jgi:hypothetical protein
MDAFHGQYARRDDPIYHTQVRCSEGGVFRDHAELRGPTAEEGRELCEECEALTPREIDRPRFGGPPYRG